MPYQPEKIEENKGEIILFSRAVSDELLEDR
jgi:hypothetical protein